MSRTLLGLASVLLALPLFATQPAPTANTQAAESSSTSPVVVLHGGDLALRDRLHAASALWCDAGEFLVAELTRPEVEWLGRSGVWTRTLSDLRANEELRLLQLDLEASLARLEAAGGRVLFRHGSGVLAAIDAGAAPALSGLEPGRHFHEGLSHVGRKAATPPLIPGGRSSAVRAADPHIQGMVDAVSATLLEQSVVSLSGLYNRCASDPGAVTARDMIAAQLTGYGYAPVFEAFDPLYAENVVVEIPGTLAPNSIVVLGAHYDSITSSCGSAAPGADDNASGTAGVMEAARVLANGGPYRNTVRFVLFCAEEHGLIGSSYHASQAAAAGEDIIAMLNSDMSAYRESGDALDVDFVTNNSSGWLIDFCDLAGATYVSNWASTTGTFSFGSSDHRSFFQNGFPAVWIFEDLDAWSPYIHSTGDAHPQSTNDFALAQMITRGMVAAAAELADPVSMDIAHTPLGDSVVAGPFGVTCQVTSLTGASVTGVDLVHRVDGGGWATLPMALQGSDWTAQIPDPGSPVVVEYYLRAQDDQGRADVLPGGAPDAAQPFAFFVGIRNLHTFYDFEAADDEGWTHGQDLTQDDWQRDAPNGLSGDPGAAWSGQNVWANDVGAPGWNGAYAAGVSNWLRSPVFDLSLASDVQLRYRRWLTVEEATYDQAQIRLNGAVIWENPVGSNLVDSAWVEHVIDISALADGNPAVQIEFRLISDGGLQYGGWNIDDFALETLGPVPCPVPANFCTASANSTGLPARIDWSGSTSLAANDFVLEARDCPAGQFGIFYLGVSQVQFSAYAGFQCVSGSTHRLPLLLTTAGGEASQNLDALSFAGVYPIAPGDVLQFQFWYRDGVTANFSDGLSVVFCP